MANKNARSDIIKLKWDGKKRGPDLPPYPMVDKEGNIVEWHPLAVAWWEALRNSPQALMLTTEPDWMSALGTCLIVHTMWQNGRWEFAAEVRQRENNLGLTPYSRRTMKVEVIDHTENSDPYSVGDAGNEGQAGVTFIDDARRNRVINQ